MVVDGRGRGGVGDGLEEVWVRSLRDCLYLFSNGVETKRTIQATPQLVGLHFLPSFLNKLLLLLSSLCLSIFGKYRLGWYLQKALRYSSENLVFGSRCSEYCIMSIMTYLILGIYVYLYYYLGSFIIGLD